MEKILFFPKQGASDRVIVVGAHYDCVEQTFGTDDNASGVGVLLELASIYSTKGISVYYSLRPIFSRGAGLSWKSVLCR